MLTQRVDFESGIWTNDPVRAISADSGFLVEAKAFSDAWRYTSYGFLHDTEHGLLKPFAQDSSVEVTFRCELKNQFDQAGILIRHDDSHWIKAGVEFVDGRAQVGAVVTHEFSDWSVAPVDGWLGKEVTIRASWSGDAVTIRAKAEGEDFRLVRLAHWSQDFQTQAGPMLCSPSRGGFSINFTTWTSGPSDGSLHD